MIFRIKFLTPILILPCLTTSTIAQKLKKADKTTLANLQSHVHYLADPKWAGRKTGTPGEKAASDYISIALGQAGVQPKGDNNGWLQTFEIDQGREVSSDAYFIANDKPFQLDKEYFPLPFSATTPVTGSPAIALQESGEPWFFDLKELVEANAGNPKFDLAGAIRMKVAACTKKGATALILYNSSRTADNLAYNPGERPAPEAIPVVYITREAKRKYLRDESASVDLRIKIGFSEKRRTGHNVIGFLNNNAATTVVIGAHYDHADTTNGNGANDNASGVAGMIELARMLAVSRLKSNNYLFVAFSGATEPCEGCERALAGGKGEVHQGRYGSRYLVEHSPVEVRKLNYMVNLDMIGRLNDSSHVLTLGGFGSSPSWGDLCNGIKAKKDFSLRLERTGDLSGDHNWFYQKDIPVLFLATGDHPNAVAGGDDPDKINYTGELEVIKFVYDIVEAANARGRFAFTKAKG